MTWNNIVMTFEGIANTNPFIKRFGDGEMVDIETDGPNSPLYPLLWIVPQYVNITENSLEYTVRVLVIEPDEEDDSKQRSILSDNLQILIDVIKTFRYEIDTDYVIVDTDLICNPFAHRFVDYCVGWWCDIKIATDLNNSPCNISGY